MNKNKFLVCSLGEILIDFTSQGRNEQEQLLFAQNAGGAPANVAAAIAKLGAKSVFIGKAGKDLHGRFLKNTLEALNVNTDGLILSDEYFTTLAFVDIKKNGEREFSFARQYGADEFLEKSDIQTEIIQDSKILHIGSVSQTDEPSRTAVFYAVKTAKECGTLVSYDPNYRETLWKNEVEAKTQMCKMLEYADLVKLSDEETELVTGEADCEKAADAILNMGAGIVAVTLGEKGAFVKTKNNKCFVEGLKSNVIDTTGAGDTFWGAFLYRFGMNGEASCRLTVDKMREFTLYANVAASLSVEKFGGISSLPSPEDIENIYDLLV